MEMPVLRSLVGGIKALFRKEERNREIDEELEGYLEAAIAEKVGRGIPRDSAERAARAEVGSAAVVRHRVWSAGWEATAESLGQDVRFGVRQLLKSPGFSLVAILSLGLGVGANTAIFTLINDLLLKSLPVHEPQQLVSFGKSAGGGILGSASAGPLDIFPYDFYKKIEREHAPFESVAALGSFPTQVSVRRGAGESGAATQANSSLVSGTFFGVLGTEPILGRTIHTSDAEAAGGNPVAVLSYGYWQHALSADPAVIGRTLTINGTLFTVVGVMPSSFYGVELNEEMPDMWLPVTMQQDVMQQQQGSLVDPGGMFWLHMIARRKTGVSLGQAQAWTTAQLQQFLMSREGARLSASRRREIATTYVPLAPIGAGISHLRDNYEAPLAVLMGVVVLVLLIACANLANFLLAKAVSREREFTTRLALGSTRTRIVRQILTETLLLAFIGGILGLAFAFLGTRALIAFVVGKDAHSALGATPDLHVLAFTSAICLATGVLFGIAPALRVSRMSASGALNATARTVGSGGGRSGRLLPRALVVGQVMLSLVLLAVAGLFVRTLHNLRNQDLGFNRTNLLLVNTNPKFAGYKPEQLNALYQRILTRMQQLPGVRSAALSGWLPIARGNWGSPITIIGRPITPNEELDTYLQRVTAGYFETLGIPLLRGRTIDASDTATSLKAVVVNETLANLYFPHGDAIGHSFTVADPGVKGTWQIVGIVRDAKFKASQNKPEPMAYLAVTQLTEDDHYAYTLQVQSVGDPANLIGEVRAAFAEIDGNLPILKVQTISEETEGLIDTQKLVSQLSGFFALLALALSCLGLYGVMMFSVVRRTNEIGVRIALGAPTLDVLWMVMRESLVLLGIGMAVGVPVMLAACQAVRAGLFGLGPWDATTLVGAMVIIAVVTMVAAYLPARRATKIDPLVALRYE
jgi:predicted permease